MNQSSENQLPDSAVKQARNIVTDSRLATVVGLIPILGLVYILRLVQWYLLAKKYPVLRSGDAGEHAELAKKFRGAWSRLWFAVLFWPAMVLFLIIYVKFHR